MRATCDDAWFTNISVDAATLDVARLLGSVPDAVDALGAAGGAGFDVEVVEVDTAGAGHLVVWGRLRVGRRRRRVEVRLDPWSHTESRLRLAPARRGIHRTLPGPQFYADAQQALIAVHDVLTLLGMGVQATTLRSAA